MMIEMLQKLLQSQKGTKFYRSCVITGIQSLYENWEWELRCQQDFWFEDICLLR